MQSIKQIQRLNERELDQAIPPTASWHTDYRDTAYIYIGGLPLDLSEGDVLTIFSQYGDIVWIRMMRDKETGKSKGFAWLKYEDQRSCDLAVDNLSGAQVLGRMLAVDHTRYKKREDEDVKEGYVGQDREQSPIAQSENRSRRQRSKSRSKSLEARPLIKEEIELRKLIENHDDDDPMKAYLLDTKRAEIKDALEKTQKSSRRKRDKDTHGHRDRDRRHCSHTPDHKSRQRRSRSRNVEDRHREDRHARLEKTSRRNRSRDRSLSPKR